MSEPGGLSGLHMRGCFFFMTSYLNFKHWKQNDGYIKKTKKKQNTSLEPGTFEIQL